MASRPGSVGETAGMTGREGGFGPLFVCDSRNCMMLSPSVLVQTKRGRPAVEWMLMPYRKLYALIAGRSSRKEFWMFFLLNVIVYFVFIVVLLGLAGGAASMMDVNSMQAA